MKRLPHIGIFCHILGVLSLIAMQPVQAFSLELKCYGSIQNYDPGDGAGYGSIGSPPSMAHLGGWLWW